uniref:Uncharacterized protein n=1 Tax=Arion vulgaris TaxID=1028688 RepID=A0A0B6ZK52_9EUPU
MSATVQGQAPVCASCPPTIRELIGCTDGLPHNVAWFVHGSDSIDSALFSQLRNMITANSEVHKIKDCILF